MHRISDRVDFGKTICSILHQHFHDEKDDATYSRTVELLCHQPDTDTGPERLCFRCSRHCYNMLSADILCDVHLSLAVEAF